jgi:hypothetical protein
MPTLTDEIREFIVIRLACFETPTQVADAVKAEFGVVLDRRAVCEYDPTKKGTRPAKKWKAIFAATRAKMLDHVSEEPAAFAAFRVHKLARMAERAEARKNDPAAAVYYKQIAEDVGGMYTNRREVTGKNGAPLLPTPALEELSEIELAALAARMAAAQE